MKTISKQSKSFIVLFCIAILGTYFAMNLSEKANKREAGLSNELAESQVLPAEENIETPAVVTEPEITVDTENWKEYSDKKYNFSFKINPDWKVSAKQQKNGEYLLEIDPGAKYYNIKIYVSKNGFFALDGLPTEETKIANLPALAINDMLYGLKKDDLYLTFDLGSSLSLRPQFKAMVNTIAFK